MRNHILNPFTISDISGSFVSISYVSKKCFNLPASGKFGTFLTDNKLFTHGWTFFRSSIGITCENNMLKRVSFVFIFTLESTASISFWPVVSVWYFLSRFPHLLSRKNFVFSPPVLLLGASEGLFWQGFIFFLPFLANISMAYFFWFSWSHKVLSKLFSKQTYVYIMPLQQICLIPQHFFGLLHRAFEGC